MRVMTNGAAFPQSFVLKDKRAGLRRVALRATLILTRHGEPTRGLQNVTTVRVMAIHAIHVALDDRVMLRQGKFRMGIQVTLEQGFRILAGIDDKLGRTTGADVLAAGVVAGCTAAPERVSRHRQNAIANADSSEIFGRCPRGNPHTLYCLRNDSRYFQWRDRRLRGRARD